MAENLKKTLLIDGTEYNINAVYSDEAGKVTNHLTVKESGSNVFDFDGSAAKSIDYVPADKGGTFANPIYLSNPTALPADSEIITSGQIDNRIVTLKNCEPLCLWDTSFEPTDISKSLYVLKDNTDKAYAFTTITGTESDFYLLQDAINGDFNLVSQDLTYSIVNSMSAATLGWKTSALLDSAAGVIVVPSNYKGKYLDLQGRQQEVTTHVAEITTGTFRGNTKITSVVLPETISFIGSNAFSGCTNLKSVIIPNKVRSIVSYTDESIVSGWFDGCTKLHKVIFNDGDIDDFTDIGAALFRNCTSLTSIIIPKYVRTIGEEAFKGCSSLTSIVIPESVTSIAANAFVNCPNLSTIYYTGSETQWNNISTSATGNSSINAATKIYNYVVTDQAPSGAPSASIDLSEISKGPFIYICKEEESADTPASNKVFLKLPGASDIVEISKGAARLETPRDAKVSGYYTYETLAAIIAGINARLDGLGGSTLKLPTTLPTTGSVIVQEGLHTDVLEDPFTEEIAAIVPTVQQLETAISKIQGKNINNIADIIDNNNDSLKKLRDDLDQLTLNVEYELNGGAIGEAVDYANSRIDKLEDDLATFKTDTAETIDDLQKTIEDTIDTEIAELKETVDNLDDSDISTLLNGKFATRTVGGITSNSKIEANSVAELLRKILGVADGVFSFNLSPSSATLALGTQEYTVSASWKIEDGKSTSDTTYTPVVGGKSATASTAKNGTITGIQITGIQNSTQSKTVSGSATYDGGSLSCSRNFDIRRTCYYGTEAQAKAATLNSVDLQSKNGWTVSKSVENDYLVFYYPQAWGAIRSITDKDTGYEALNDTISLVAIESGDQLSESSSLYYKYRTNNKQTGMMNFIINN